ncbi:unnamed protein product [Victoria cruziana]
MHNCKPVNTPMAKGECLTNKMCPETLEEKMHMSKVSYSNAIGRLMYLIMCTRPDICHAVGMVSRYQSNPGREHWKAVKRIMQYLKGTEDFALCYQGGSTKIEGYTDADWGGDPDERKSTSAYVFLLNKGAISWCSKKQTCVALSTMEAEFVAGSIAVQEGVWLRRIVKHLGVLPHAKDPIIIYCDNQAAITYVKDPKFHSKTKHIDTRCKYQCAHRYLDSIGD